MKVKLTRAAKVTLAAGEIVDISPAQAQFLIAVHSAEPVEEPTQPKPAPEAKKTATTKKAGKK